MKVWIFQANPERYRITEALRDVNIGEEMHWLVNQYKDAIKSGDIGMIWKCGQDTPGIYAILEITSNPDFFDEPPTEKQYWTSEHDKKDQQLRVKFKIIQNLLSNPITKREIKTIVGLENLSILHKYQGVTNSPVTQAEWAIIENMLLNRANLQQ